MGRLSNKIRIEGRLHSKQRQYLPTWNRPSGTWLLWTSAGCPGSTVWWRRPHRLSVRNVRTFTPSPALSTHQVPGAGSSWHTLLHCQNTPRRWALPLLSCGRKCSQKHLDKIPLSPLTLSVTAMNLLLVWEWTRARPDVSNKTDIDMVTSSLWWLYRTIQTWLDFPWLIIYRIKLKTQKFYVAITDSIIHISLFWIKKMSMNFFFKIFIIIITDFAIPRQSWLGFIII